MTAVGGSTRPEPALVRWWWVLLATGVLWILLGIFVLQGHFDSAVAIGHLIAFWLIFGGVAEFVQAGLLEGWKWLHILLGGRFVVGGARCAHIAVPDLHRARVAHRVLPDPQRHVRLRDGVGSAP